MNDGPHVVVVEDDEDDFFLTQRTLKKFVGRPIVQVENGQAAIEYLSGQGQYANRMIHPLPDVMFLDLKMNQVNGIEVLEWVHANLPEGAPRIYVLTGSNEPRDRERVKQSGVASGYIVKPLSPEHLSAIFGDPPSPA